MKSDFSRTSKVVFATFFIAALLVGFVTAAQIRILGLSGNLANLTNAELLVLSSEINNEIISLRAEKNELQEKIENYQNSGGSKAIVELENELKVLQVITAAKPVEGSGIEIKIEGDIDNFGTHMLLDIINELKAAGAVAIGINGIRLDEKTYVNADGDVILVNGKEIDFPIKIEAIGDPEQLLGSMNMPGGMINVYESMGAFKASIITVDKIYLPRAVGSSQ